MTVRARRVSAYLNGAGIGRMQGDVAGPDARLIAAGGTPSGPRPPCPRCGCRISRYASWSETHCAPCAKAIGADDALETPVFASSAEQARAAATTPTRRRTCDTCGEPLDRRNANGRCQTCRGMLRHDTCACGAPKYHAATHCKRCSGIQQRNPGSVYSIVCKCGATKKKGSKTCILCRYPNSDAARQRRLDERAA